MPTEQRDNEYRSRTIYRVIPLIVAIMLIGLLIVPMSYLGQGFQ